MTSELVPYRRPGYGDQGRMGSRDRQATVLTNMFEIETRNLTFCQYVIEFKRDTRKGPTEFTGDSAGRRRIRRQVFAAFHKLNKVEYFKDVGVAYDGGSNLFTTSKLTLSNNQISQLVEVENDCEYYVEIRENHGKPTISMNDLKEVLTGETFEWDFFDNQMLNALNAFVQYNPALKFVQYGDSFFMPESRRSLGEGAELLQGYFLSVRPGEGDGRGKLFLNVNTTYTVTFEPNDLCTLICKYLNTQNLPDLFRPEITSLLNKAFRHIRVTPSHRPESVHTIKRFHDLPADKTMFPNKELGRDESVKDLFARKYRKHLNTPFLVEDTRGSKHPIEVLTVIEGQHYRGRPLSGKQRGEMIKITAKVPAENKRLILNGVHDVLAFSKDDILQKAGIKINARMANVPGRFISTPEVLYSNSSKQGPQIKPKDWDAAWNLRDVHYLKSGETLKTWMAISLTQSVSPDNMNRFMKSLARQARTQGMDVASDSMQPKQIRSRIEQARNEIVRTVEEARRRTGGNLQLVVFFIDSDKSPMNTKQYNLVKEVMDTHVGILSQCIQSHHVAPCKPQYLANVTAKLNLKLNGVNSAVNLPRINRQRIMVMGADVTHPPPESTDFPSIAAVVASIDRYAARYAERHMAQFKEAKANSKKTGRGKEEIDGMEELTHKLLLEFIRINEKPPESIIMYRDGISESQFKPLALDKELPSIRRACHRLNPNYNPKISYIVVCKRHHNRFYPIDRQDADNKGNVKPGLVVERVITHPYLFNFYLTSHSSLQGTSRPSLYHVLHDENGFEVDELQDFTNKLCYNFQRATRAVSIPAPTYYAHCAAKRARSHFYNGQLSMTKIELAKKYPMYYV
ncbi:10694_t:CDS:2 [Paraglomus occultum]|uniref:10694_t:CDS:1 n=1 Tax=Paraglomus occultum TaxID=144539 RepID=A0A9N8WHV4_9GLOM|nr:10694_t:CDS:2 [Paraglomus occultum]